jgi:non-lysosomal glucosylceramidase
LFWDEFAAKGRLEAEPDPRGPVGAVCIRKEIPAGGEADFTFVLAWRFPNRTPEHCGWRAGQGHEKTIVGNHYSTRFADSWAAAEHLAANLRSLESQTRAFVKAVQDSTLPGSVKDAAMSNLSTLVTQVCFRTADGEFHGFEGANDRSGCCHGSCTHVWNYETATAHLFPSLSRSLRNASFGHMLDERGAIHFRETLPKGSGRSGLAAADGQMGQIMKAWLDYRLSGDKAWLESIWPGVKKAVEFSWIPGGWDADRDGVLEGVQHNTYDVEFYGPNPQCGIYYLGALRAAEEMARAAGDLDFAAACRGLFEKGSKWIDANLFNGEFYIQKVRGVKKEDIAPALVSNMGSDNTEQPEFQVGDGCLVDQLIGQYQADVCSLGPLLNPGAMSKTLASIYRYNYKRPMAEHESVQRTFALNDESAVVICDYGKGTRPKIPFPYYAEVMTGFEYAAAAHMIYAGMVTQGLECIESIRARYDGERRSPWDEAECGHHYARAMAAWSAILALSGFSYDAPKAKLDIAPRLRRSPFRSFWSTASGWGTFEAGTKLTITALAGRLDIKELTLRGKPVKLTAPAIVEPGRPFSV